MLSLFPLLVVLLAPAASQTAASAEDEMSFGIDVAKRGLWSEARFRFERAVALDPENAEALNDLGVALEQQGEFAKAREVFDRALKLKPGNLYIQQNYDLFREADDKRNRKKKVPNANPTPSPAPNPSPGPSPNP
jgi:Flp pilus assembly protein TadD